MDKEIRYYKDVAEYIKKEFDEKFGGTWHVIVGNISLNFNIFYSFNTI